MSFVVHVDETGPEKEEGNQKRSVVSEQESPQNDILMPLLVREHENSEGQAVTRGVKG